MCQNKRSLKAAWKPFQSALQACPISNVMDLRVATQSLLWHSDYLIQSALRRLALDLTQTVLDEIIAAPFMSVFGPLAIHKTKRLCALPIGLSHRHHTENQLARVGIRLRFTSPFSATFLMLVLSNLGRFTLTSAFFCITCKLPFHLSFVGSFIDVFRSLPILLSNCYHQSMRLLIPLGVRLLRDLYFSPKVGQQELPLEPIEEMSNIPCQSNLMSDE